jgi:hypothetical protein
VDAVSNEEEEVLDLMAEVSCSLLSFEPRSKVLPGVLGVFVEEPKEANAPEPSPNAFDAPTDGEETPPERGDMALKGLDRPWELSGPKRFDEWVRGSSGLELPSLSLVVDSDSLFALHQCARQQAES